LEVPPPPAEFDRQLHQRVNRALVLRHFLDLTFNGIPWAMLHFLRAVVALAGVTLTGRLDTKPVNGRRHEP
jgi:hypothetical protein